MSRRNPVKVAVRTRPTANFAQQEIVIDQEQNTIEINHQTADAEEMMNNKQNNYRFQYHHVLHQASQDAVYELARPVVQGAVDGVNGTVMSYGQTGSGKTFTMVGDTRNYQHRGVAPRALAHVFQEVAARVETAFTVTCTYLEIYNERVFDLLADHAQQDQRQTYTIMEEPGRRGIYVRGLTEVEVHSEQEAMNLLYSGELARTTAQHKLNRRSNRSHCIFTVFLQYRNRSGVSEKINCAKLHLVDLAGSERLKKTLDSTSKNDETIKKESMHINQSLSYLEQCVVALSRRQPGHVPYRQTKLTNILKDALGGNCNTLLLACVWGEAAHLEETTSTLRLAARMMRVQNESFAVEVLDPYETIKKQERALRDLRQELLMHDALAERSGVGYDPLTPEQQQALRARAEAYVAAAPEEEEDLLDPALQSVRQIKELCRQFKLMVLEYRAELARRDALPPGTALGAHPLGLGAGGTLGAPGTAGLGGVGHAGGLAGPGGAGSPGGYGGGGEVGEEERGGGFGLGLADPHARPATVDQPGGGGGGGGRTVQFSQAAGGRDGFGFAEASGGGMGAAGGGGRGGGAQGKEGPLSPGPGMQDKEEFLAGFDTGGGGLRGSSGPGGGGGGRAQSKKERAYDLFKKSEGKHVNDQLLRLKRRAKEAKREAKGAAAAINEAKLEIDALANRLRGKHRASERARLESETSAQHLPAGAAAAAAAGAAGADDIMDEEEYRLVQAERGAKKAYKAAFERYRSLKEEIAAGEKQVEGLKFQLLADFEAWNSGARALLATAGGPGGGGGGGGGSSPGGGGFPEDEDDDEDKLDDTEAFEKMERERVLAQDPDALAFFQAQKTRIATKNQNALALRQMHKNKRIK